LATRGDQTKASVYFLLG